jgi:hypothetical protein
LFSSFEEDLGDAFYFSGLEFFMHTFAFFSFLRNEEPPLLACPFCSTQHKWDPLGYFFLPLVFGVWVSLIQVEPDSRIILILLSSIRFFAKSCTFA